MSFMVEVSVCLGAVLSCATPVDVKARPNTATAVRVINFKGDIVADNNAAIRDLSTRENHAYKRTTGTGKLHPTRKFAFSL